MGSPVCASSTTKGAQQSDPADYQRAGGGRGALENLPLFVSDSQEGFFLCSLLLPVSVLSNIRASRCSPCTSLEDEKDFLTLPGSASNVNTRALSSCSREPPL